MVFVQIIGFETQNRGEEETKKVAFTKEINDDIFFGDVPYTKVRLMIENDDLKDGMQVKVLNGCGYLSKLDEERYFTVLNINVSIEFPKDPKISDSDDEDENSDNEDENSDNEDEKIDWANELDIEYEYDTHYDCYCKTQKVCGCGCDPLHDGW